MKINPRGLSLLKSFEGCKLKAYPDPATGSDPWTIGYGSTGPDVEEGILWTQEQADRRLRQDLMVFERHVETYVKVPLNDNQFSALVCFSYNVGLGNLKKSTLIKKLNANDYHGAADQFLVWNKAAGKEMAGLTRRRKAERELFLS